MAASSGESAWLVLADGTVFSGLPCGAGGSVVGEVVFNTGMTGYQEVLTDPSYYGQLVTFTYPELGNTGVNPDDQEADKPQAQGLIARQLSPVASNWRSRQSLQDWLTTHGVIGIHGIDTRALVRHLRETGAMNGVISSDGRSPAELLELVRSAPSMEGLNLVDRVSTTTPYGWSAPCAVDFDRRLHSGRPESPYRVVAIDFAGRPPELLVPRGGHFPLGGVSTTRPKSANATDLCRNGRNYTFPNSDRESDTRFPLLTCASELMGTSAFLNDPKLVISIGIATPKCQFSAPAAPKIGTLRVLVGAADHNPPPDFQSKFP